ncbi:hypothetical protein [Anaerotignum sp.]
MKKMIALVLAGVLMMSATPVLAAETVSAKPITSTATISLNCGI